MATETHIPDVLHSKKGEREDDDVLSSAIIEEKVKQLEISSQVAETVNTHLETESGTFFQALSAPVVIADEISSTPEVCKAATIQDQEERKTTKIEAFTEEKKKTIGDKSVQSVASKIEIDLQEDKREQELEESANKPVETYSEIKQEGGTVLQPSVETEEKTEHLHTVTTDDCNKSQTESQLESTKLDDQTENFDIPSAKEVYEEMDSENVKYKEEVKEITNENEIVSKVENIEKGQEVYVSGKDEDFTSSQEAVSGSIGETAIGQHITTVVGFKEEAEEKSNDAQEASERYKNGIKENIEQNTSSSGVETNKNEEKIDEEAIVSKEENAEKVKELNMSEEVHGGGDDVISSQNAPIEDIKESTIGQHATTVAYIEEGQVDTPMTKEILKEEVVDAQENEVKDKTEQSQEESVNEIVQPYSEIEQEKVTEEITEEKADQQGLMHAATTDDIITAQTDSQVESVGHEVKSDDSQKETFDSPTVKEVCEETSYVECKEEVKGTSNENEVTSKVEDQEKAQETSKQYANEAKYEIEQNTSSSIVETKENEEKIDEEAIVNDDGQLKKSESEINEDEIMSKEGNEEKEQELKMSEEVQGGGDDAISSQNASTEDIKEPMFIEIIKEEEEDKKIDSQEASEKCDVGTEDKRDQNPEEIVNNSVESSSEIEQEEDTEEAKPSVEKVQQVCEEADSEKIEYREEVKYSDISNIETTAKEECEEKAESEEGSKLSDNLNISLKEKEIASNVEDEEKEQEVFASGKGQDGDDDVTSSQDAKCEDIKETTIGQHVTTEAYLELMPTEILKEEVKDKSSDAQEASGQYESGANEKIEQNPEEESVNKNEEIKASVEMDEKEKVKITGHEEFVIEKVKFEGVEFSGKDEEQERIISEEDQGIDGVTCLQDATSIKEPEIIKPRENIEEDTKEIKSIPAIKDDIKIDEKAIVNDDGQSQTYKSESPLKKEVCEGAISEKAESALYENEIVNKEENQEKEQEVKTSEEVEGCEDDGTTSQNASSEDRRSQDAKCEDKKETTGQHVTTESILESTPKEILKEEEDKSNDAQQASEQYESEANEKIEQKLEEESVNKNGEIEPSVEKNETEKVNIIVNEEDVVGKIKIKGVELSDKDEEQERIISEEGQGIDDVTCLQDATSIKEPEIVKPRESIEEDTKEIKSIPEIRDDTKIEEEAIVKDDGQTEKSESPLVDSELIENEMVRKEEIEEKEQEEKEKEQEVKTSEEVKSCEDDDITSQNASNDDIKETTIVQHATTMTYFDDQEDKNEQNPEESDKKTKESCSEIKQEEDTEEVKPSVEIEQQEVLPVVTSQTESQVESEENEVKSVVPNKSGDSQKENVESSSVNEETTSEKVEHSDEVKETASKIENEEKVQEVYMSGKGQGGGDDVTSSQDAMCEDVKEPLVGQHVTTFAYLEERQALSSLPKEETIVTEENNQESIESDDGQIEKTLIPSVNEVYEETSKEVSDETILQKVESEEGVKARETFKDEGQEKDQVESVNIIENTEEIKPGVETYETKEKVEITRHEKEKVECEAVELENEPKTVKIRRSIDEDNEEVIYSVETKEMEEKIEEEAIVNHYGQTNMSEIPVVKEVCEVTGSENAVESEDEERVEYFESSSKALLNPFEMVGKGENQEKEQEPKEVKETMIGQHVNTVVNFEEGRDQSEMIKESLKEEVHDKSSDAREDKTEQNPEESFNKSLQSCSEVKKEEDIVDIQTSVDTDVITNDSCIISQTKSPIGNVEHEVKSDNPIQIDDGQKDNVKSSSVNEVREETDSEKVERSEEVKENVRKVEDEENKQEVYVTGKGQGDGDDVTTSQDSTCEDIQESTIGQHESALTKDILKEEVEDKSTDAQEASQQYDQNRAKDKTDESANIIMRSYSEIEQEEYTEEIKASVETDEKEQQEVCQETDMKKTVFEEGIKVPDSSDMIVNEKEIDILSKDEYQEKEQDLNIPEKEQCEDEVAASEKDLQANEHEFVDTRENVKEDNEVIITNVETEEKVEQEETIETEETNKEPIKSDVKTIQNFKDEVQVNMSAGQGEDDVTSSQVAALEEDLQTKKYQEGKEPGYVETRESIEEEDPKEINSTTNVLTNDVCNSTGTETLENEENIKEETLVDDNGQTDKSFNREVFEVTVSEKAESKLNENEIVSKKENEEKEQKVKISEEVKGCEDDVITTQNASSEDIKETTEMTKEISLEDLETVSEVQIPAVVSQSEDLKINEECLTTATHVDEEKGTETKEIPSEEKTEIGENNPLYEKGDVKEDVAEENQLTSTQDCSEIKSKDVILTKEISESDESPKQAFKSVCDVQTHEVVADSDDLKVTEESIVSNITSENIMENTKLTSNEKELTDEVSSELGQPKGQIVDEIQTGPTKTISSEIVEDEITHKDENLSHESIEDANDTTSKDERYFEAVKTREIEPVEELNEASNENSLDFIKTAEVVPHSSSTENILPIEGVESVYDTQVPEVGPKSEESNLKEDCITSATAAYVDEEKETVANEISSDETTESKQVAQHLSVSSCDAVLIEENLELNEELKPTSESVIEEDQVKETKPEPEQSDITSENITSEKDLVDAKRDMEEGLTFAPEKIQIDSTEHQNEIIKNAILTDEVAVETEKEKENNEVKEHISENDICPTEIDQTSTSTSNQKEVADEIIISKPIPAGNSEVKAESATELENIEAAEAPDLEFEKKEKVDELISDIQTPQTTLKMEEHLEATNDTCETLTDSEKKLVSIVPTEELASSTIEDQTNELIPETEKTKVDHISISNKDQNLELTEEELPKILVTEENTLEEHANKEKETSGESQADDTHKFEENPTEVLKIASVIAKDEVVPECGEVSEILPENVPEASPVKKIEPETTATRIEETTSEVDVIDVQKHEKAFDCTTEAITADGISTKEESFESINQESKSEQKEEAVEKLQREISFEKEPVELEISQRDMTNDLVKIGQTQPELQKNESSTASSLICEPETKASDTELQCISDILNKEKKTSDEKENPEVTENLTEEREKALKEETGEKRGKTEEENEEEDDEDNHVNGAPVMVEASKDIEVKAHKKSHNILSGVGSKVKHSIAKVKKAITGKSSSPKPSSPKEKDQVVT